ncbi:hypothetical protein [Trichocoleus sp. Lan]
MLLTSVNRDGTGVQMYFPTLEYRFLVIRSFGYSSIAQEQQTNPY